MSNQGTEDPNMSDPGTEDSNVSESNTEDLNMPKKLRFNIKHDCKMIIAICEAIQAFIDHDHDLSAENVAEQVDALSPDRQSCDEEATVCNLDVFTRDFWLAMTEIMRYLPHRSVEQIRLLRFFRALSRLPKIPSGCEYLLWSTPFCNLQTALRWNWACEFRLVAMGDIYLDRC
jgi:hypothetical protein